MNPSPSIDATLAPVLAGNRVRIPKTFHRLEGEEGSFTGSTVTVNVIRYSDRWVVADGTPDEVEVEDAGASLRTLTYWTVPDTAEPGDYVVTIDVTGPLTAAYYVLVRVLGRVFPKTGGRIAVTAGDGTADLNGTVS